MGHIIRVNKDEIVPADLILLETMDSSHLCYLDVSAITGVFDRFVLKKACVDTQTPVMKTIKFNEYVKNLRGEIRYEEPDSNINSFNGRMKLESFPRASDITEEHFVMRGATIKNIKCVYGIVVYTGMETKIMQILKSDKKNNSQIVKEDRNFIETTLRHAKLLAIFLYVLIIFFLSLSLMHKSYMFYAAINDYWYLSYVSPYLEFFYSFLEFVYTMYLLIPFTWLNLMGAAYLLLSVFLKWDVKVIQKRKNTVDVINYDCLADFGQVKYILADKTGTLTSRKFLLKACSIRGKIYSFDPLDRKDENYIFRMKNYDVTDLELYQDLKSNSSPSNYIKEFFEFLCVCHNIKLVRNDKKGDVMNSDKVFGSSFAEEKSILKMLKNIGYNVIKAKHDSTTIEINGEVKTYHIIGRNKYSDERGRMSVIVKRNKGDSDSTLLCKGNDLSIFNFIRRDNETEHSMIIDQIHKLGSIGLRYFVFCKKELSEEETSSYVSSFKSAENYVMQRDFHFEKLANEFEYNMELLGVLFFEEKVSSDLRYSINKLNNSNINVWVVSGDRKENVMAVSKNMDRYKSSSILVEFSEKDDLDDLDIKMNMYLLQFLGSGEQMLRMKTRKGVDIGVEANHAVMKKSKNKDLTMLIHGSCFNMICNDPRLYQCFATLLAYTTSLFAYSFSPNNKFLLCQTLKKFVTKNAKVLAIGDGLNDFMMLKEADVSVGIRSKEILQVRNSCDIIVCKFPQIVDLILIHGTWNVKRLYDISMFSLYSNVLIVFPFFLHQYSNTIGSSFFEINYMKLVLDILVLNLTVILVFCFDQKVERSMLGLNPSMYLDNFSSWSTTIYMFFKKVAKGAVDSVIIYYSYFIVLGNPMNIEGQNTDVVLMGYIIGYTCYIVIYTKLVFVKLSNINLGSVVVLLVSFGSMIGLTFIFEDVTTAAYQSLSFLSVFLMMLFTIGLCYIYEKFIISFEVMFFPSFLYNVTRKFKKFVDGK